MRVAFLTQDLQLSGGVGVVIQHAAQLARRGLDVDLVLMRPTAAPEWSYRGLEHLRVLSLELARTRRYDVALASWWETTQQLFELEARTHAWFVQSLEDRFFAAEDPRQHAAALALDLPVRFITEARWIAATIERLRPGEKVFYVRNGIAKDVFTPVARVPVAREGPLRVLVEGSVGVAFKGVREALDAIDAMSEPRHVTVVAPDGCGRGLDGVERALGPLPQGELAGVYAQTDVLLKLSRVEGMSGPPLEAFHLGATCVTTPVTGHDEYVVHGENALVVDWDDTFGTARALDLLARDRVLLHRLRHGALATARAWPSWEQQGEMMAAVLHALRREPAPDGRAAGLRLAHDFAAALSDGERLAMDLAATRAALGRAEGSRGHRLEQGARRLGRAPRRLLRRWRPY